MYEYIILLIEEALYKMAIKFKLFLKKSIFLKKKMENPAQIEEIKANPDEKVKKIQNPWDLFERISTIEEKPHDGNSNEEEKDSGDAETPKKRKTNSKRKEKVKDFNEETKFFLKISKFS